MECITVRVATMPSKGSSKGSKKAKKSGSNVFDMFTQAQVAEFKDGFAIMDRDNDGVLSKEAVRAFEKNPGEIDMDAFRNMLKAFGDKFTDQEVTDAYAAFDEFVDEDTNMLDCDGIIGMLCAGGD